MIVETCPKCSKSERSRKCGPAADSKWYALMVIQRQSARWQILQSAQVADTAASQVADTVAILDPSDRLTEPNGMLSQLDL